MSEENTKKAKLGFWSKFFIFLGIIFSIIIVIIVGGIIFLLVAKPFGADVTQLPAIISDESMSENLDDDSLLTPTLEKSLRSIGIDPATIPDEVTNKQEACARGILGDARVDEIAGGDTPSITDILRAKKCFE